MFSTREMTTSKSTSNPEISTQTMQKQKQLTVHVTDYQEMKTGKAISTSVTKTTSMQLIFTSKNWMMKMIHENEEINKTVYTLQELVMKFWLLLFFNTAAL